MNINILCGKDLNQNIEEIMNPMMIMLDLVIFYVIYVLLMKEIKKMSKLVVIKFMVLLNIWIGLKKKLKHYLMLDIIKPLQLSQLNFHQ
mmetsp:Transcript_58848/g.142053  ORF Transcript_58848/g.142053 Transcript_58848/m.142053 type:complete len:89 (+) Transcript_58848:97-363(+)